jgi:hypothetical protein
MSVHLYNININITGPIPSYMPVINVINKHGLLRKNTLHSYNEHSDHKFHEQSSDYIAALTA